MKTRKAHVGFLCSTRALGGMELNLLRLAQWLQVRGWTTTVLGVEGAPFFQRAHAAGGNASVIPYHKKYFDFKNARVLASTLRKERIDVLIISSNRDVNVAVLVKHFFLKSLRIVFLQQMQLGIAKKDIAHTWEFRRLDAWIAPLEWLAAQVRTNTHIQHQKIHCIPLCIETDRFSGKTVSREEARKALDIPEDAYVVGTVGRFDEGKYQEALVRAAALLAAEGNPLSVLLVGEDTRDTRQQYQQRLQTLANEEGISAHVFFRPFREDVETAYAAMDVFAMTTPSETFGMVTVEAMASGIPVVAANGGGSPELLDFGNAGILVPPRDAQALAEGIRTYRSQPDLRQRMASAAQKRALERYSHTAQCEQTETLLDAILK